MQKTVTTRLAHFPGCPAERVESYAIRRPVTGKGTLGTGELVTVERCIDCGAHAVGGQVVYGPAHAIVEQQRGGAR